MKALPRARTGPATAQGPTGKGWCPDSVGRAPSTPRCLSRQKCPLVPAAGLDFVAFEAGAGGGRALKDAVSVVTFISFVCLGLCGFAAEKEVALRTPCWVLLEAENQGGWKGSLDVSGAK